MPGHQKGLVGGGEKLESLAKFRIRSGGVRKRVNPYWGVWGWGDKGRKTSREERSSSDLLGALASSEAERIEWH